MAEKETSVSSFLDLLQNVSTPFVRQWAYGKDNAAELEAYEQSLEYRKIGGAGPKDLAAGAQAPAGLLGLLFGFSVTDQAGQTRPNPVPWILLILGIGGVVWFIFRRK
jgi:hypothetical protein